MLILTGTIRTKEVKRIKEKVKKVVIRVIANKIKKVVVFQKRLWMNTLWKLL